MSFLFKITNIWIPITSDVSFDCNCLKFLHTLPTLIKFVGPGAKYLCLNICCIPLWESYSCIWKSYVTSAVRKSMFSLPVVLVDSEIWAIELLRIRLKSCETMWLKFDQNWRNLIKDHFTHCNSESNADKTWLRKDDELMYPDRLIAPQTFNKVLTSAFVISFTTLQYLCKD